ncbi:MAG: hypothetical protein JNK72_01620 [Myxococcales bacterium]|nr:hypothetical protein [Myxococcales bacterium]
MRASTLAIAVSLLGLNACGDLPSTLSDASASGDLGADGAARDSGPGTDDLGEPPDAGVATPDAGPPEPVAFWRIPRADAGVEAWQMPWPNDLERDAEGRVTFGVLPQQGIHPLVRGYLTQFAGRLDGFSPSGAVYLRFGVPLDTSALPADAALTRSAESPVQLIDVDPSSPRRGERVPLQFYYREAPTRYWGAHTLAVAPVHGYPLRLRTRYALVATRALVGRGGVALRRDADLDAVLDPGDAGVSDPVIARARSVYTPSLAMVESAGVPRARILSMTVFTTSDPTREFLSAATWLRTQGPEPRLIDISDATDSGEYHLFRGHYGPNPIFQTGTNPYAETGSGDFSLDANGVPQVQGMEPIRFVLTVPTGRPMPEGGWPIAVYAHGTGGNAGSFVNDRTAAALAAEGVAGLGIDQIFHGERAAPGTTPDTAFFNFTNPFAGRTNNRQAGLDLVQCGRFVRALAFDARTPGGVVATRFDPNHVMFFGHSQGGLNGPLWLAADPLPQTAVLSGAAGVIALSIVLKTEPVNIPQTITSVLMLQRDELVALHPLATLLQTLADPADPINYAHLMSRAPQGAMRPKSVFLTQGFVDSYAPPPAIAALALAAGFPLTGTVSHPEPGWNILGLSPLALPSRGNLVDALGMPTATTAWMQFDAPAGRDGHFVVFDVADARLRAAHFLGSAARDPGRIPTVLGALPTM